MLGGNLYFFFEGTTTGLGLATFTGADGLKEV
jgi:hypothetical protein